MTTGVHGVNEGQERKGNSDRRPRKIVVTVCEIFELMKRHTLFFYLLLFVIYYYFPLLVAL